MLHELVEVVKDIVVLPIFPALLRLVPQLTILDLENLQPHFDVKHLPVFAVLLPKTTHNRFTNGIGVASMEPESFLYSVAAPYCYQLISLLLGPVRASVPSRW